MRPASFAGTPEPPFEIGAPSAGGALRPATTAPFFFVPFFGDSFAAGGVSESAAASAAGLPGSGGAAGGGPLGPTLEAVEVDALGAVVRNVPDEGAVDAVVADDEDDDGEEGAAGAAPGGVLGVLGACGGAFEATDDELVLGAALGLLGAVGALAGDEVDEVDDEVGGAGGAPAALASLAVFVESLAAGASFAASLPLDGLLPPRPASSMFEEVDALGLEPLPALPGFSRLATRVSVAEGSSLWPGLRRTTS